MIQFLVSERLALPAWRAVGGPYHVLALLQTVRLLSRDTRLLHSLVAAGILDILVRDIPTATAMHFAYHGGPGVGPDGVSPATPPSPLFDLSRDLDPTLHTYAGTSPSLLAAELLIEYVSILRHLVASPTHIPTLVAHHVPRLLTTLLASRLQEPTLLPLVLLTLSRLVQMDPTGRAATALELPGVAERLLDMMHHDSPQLTSAAVSLLSVLAKSASGRATLVPGDVMSTLVARLVTHAGVYEMESLAVPLLRTLATLVEDAPFRSALRLHGGVMTILSYVRGPLERKGTTPPSSSSDNDDDDYDSEGEELTEREGRRGKGKPTDAISSATSDAVPTSRTTDTTPRKKVPAGAGTLSLEQPSTPTTIAVLEPPTPTVFAHKESRVDVIARRDGTRRLSVRRLWDKDDDDVNHHHGRDSGKISSPASTSTVTPSRNQVPPLSSTVRGKHQKEEKDSTTPGASQMAVLQSELAAICTACNILSNLASDGETLASILAANGVYILGQRLLTPLAGTCAAGWTNRRATRAKSTIRVQPRRDGASRTPAPTTTTTITSNATDTPTNPTPNPSDIPTNDGGDPPRVCCSIHTNPVTWRLSLRTAAAVLRTLRNLHNQSRTRGVIKSLFPASLFADFVNVADFKKTDAYVTVAEAFAKLDRVGRASIERNLEAVNRARDAPLTTIRGYEVIDLLGRGAYGSVYRARRKGGDLGDLSSQVAMKEISLDAALFQDTTGQAPQVTNREVGILSKMKHPNVVKYHESFVESDKLYIVMELAEGTSLAEYLATFHGGLGEEDAGGAQKRSTPKDQEASARQGQGGGDAGNGGNGGDPSQHSSSRGSFVPEADVWSLLVSVTSVLQYIHVEHKMTHRDLTPSNIVLGPDPHGTFTHLKVTDFGLARELSGTVSVAASMVGTVPYMCPEMIENKAYDGKADVWSLGCILYQIITGHAPVKGKNPLAVASRIVEGDSCSTFLPTLLPSHLSLLSSISNPHLYRVFAPLIPRAVVYSLSR